MHRKLGQSTAYTAKEVNVHFIEFVCCGMVILSMASLPWVPLGKSVKRFELLYNICYVLHLSQYVIILILMRSGLMSASPQPKSDTVVSFKCNVFSPKSHCKCSNKLYVLSTEDLQLSPSSGKEWLHFTCFKKFLHIWLHHMNMYWELHWIVSWHWWKKPLLIDSTHIFLCEWLTDDAISTTENIFIQLSHWIIWTCTEYFSKFFFPFYWWNKPSLPTGFVDNQIDFVLSFVRQYNRIYLTLLSQTVLKRCNSICG